MFEKSLPDPEFPESDTDKISPFDCAMKAICTTLRRHIRTTVTLRTGRRDSFGIMLYNTKFRVPIGGENDDDNEEEDDEYDVENALSGNDRGDAMSTVHEFLALEPPGTETVMKIKSTLEDEFTGTVDFDIEKQYASSEEDRQGEVPLIQGLERAVTRFAESSYVKKPKAGEIPDDKQIWIVSTDDNPCSESSADYLKKTILDARENGVDLSIWALPKVNGDPFEYDQFYETIEKEPDTGDFMFAMPLKEAARGVAPIEAVQLVQSMMEEAQWRWKKTRQAFSIPLIMPNWKEDSERPGIALDFYRLVQTSKTPLKIPIDDISGK